MAPATVSPALTRELVLSLLPPLANDPTTLRQVTDHIAREVKADVQGSSRMTWPEAESSVSGMARTARVRVQSDLADALLKAIGQLATHRRAGQTAWEGDMPIKMSNLSQHVQFLLAMARQPTPRTHDLAHEYLHRVPAPPADDKDRELYDAIMADPFEGDHWGAGYDSEVQEGWTDSDSDNGFGGGLAGQRHGAETPSSEEDERIVTPLRPVHTSEMQESSSAEQRLRDAEAALRSMRKGMYWRHRNEDVKTIAPRVGHGWRAVSTQISVADLAASLLDRPNCITATQFQRELLFALSGRSGIMLDFDAQAKCFVRGIVSLLGCIVELNGLNQVISDHPTVQHYSPAAVDGILARTRVRADQASVIRRYVSDTLSPIGSSASTTTTPTHTAQAFAEACREYMTTGLDTWIAEQELAFIRGSSSTTPASMSTSTPLSLLSQLDTDFGPMLDSLSSVLPHTGDPVVLLNALYTLLTPTSPQHKQVMLRIFVATATPLWTILGQWLIEGMPIPRSLVDIDSRSDHERTLDPEFWIRRDRDVAWADEDFWDAAFVMSVSDTRPDWIPEKTLDQLLEAGKARGLLAAFAHAHEQAHHDARWPPLNDVLLDDSHGDDDIPDTLAEFLDPRCQLTLFQLRRVFDVECGLAAHLEAIDGFFYFRAVDVLQPWTEELFEQVIARKQWSDFHTLTGSLRETVERQLELWLNPQAIRIRSERPHGDTANGDGPINVNVLSSVRATYRVPFPLSQLFTPTSLDLRSDVFAFLLQVHFSRHLLARSRTRSKSRDTAVLSLLLFMHRLAWIIDTLYTWITERVIELECERYKVELDKTTSFGSMIQLELSHARRIRDYSFQHAKTSALNECVASILDMTADVHDLAVAVALAAESEHHQSQKGRAPTPQTPIDGHGYVQGRSRRRRLRLRQRGQKTRRVSISDSDSDRDEDEEPAANMTLKGEVSLVELGLDERVKRLDSALAKHVDRLREGLEELGRDDEVWSMLSFALQDWR